MKRFIEGQDRSQSTLFPERLEDWVSEDNPVRVIDVFVDELDLGGLGFRRVVLEVTGRPGYHPAALLKIYVYGYLNRIQSSLRLEVESQRNLELMWLTRRLAPDFKTIADFRKDNGKAIRSVCRDFIMLCRQLDLFSAAGRTVRLDVGAVDGDLIRRPRQALRQGREQILPMPFLRPAVIAIVDGCRWAVLGRTIPPPASRLENVDDAANNPPVILAPPHGTASAA